MEQEILPYLAGRLAEPLKTVDFSRLESLEEIRLRAGKPVMLHNFKNDWFLAGNGSVFGQLPENPLVVMQEDLVKTLERMSENSVYAYQDEIRNGYITLKGGHRIGLSGKVVLEGSSIRNIRDVSSMNIRLSRQIVGCSEHVLKYILKGSSDLFNTLLISPPQCGKTTILRDLARVISDGSPERGFKGMKVGIVDERSEIAACSRGIPQNQVGIRTDVLDGCPKTIGLSMMIRSMSPKVVITDEIGNEGDGEAVMRVLNAGVRIVASAHGYNISELKSRREVLKLMEEKAFERYIVLGASRGPGTLLEVVDGNSMKVLFGEGAYAS